MRNINDIVSFATNRPKAPLKLVKANFHSSNSGYSNNKCVMVVPTTDASCPLATRLARAFSPIPIIFAVSVGEYFNYAYSLNSGIAEALKYSPERVIISNDDVIPIDDVRELLPLIEEHRDVDLLVPGNVRNRYHGETVHLMRRNVFFTAIEFFWALKNLERIGNKLGALVLISEMTRSKIVPYVAYDGIRQMTLASGILKPISKPFVNFADFGIFRSDVIKVNRFDETFINGYEDYDLTIRLDQAGNSIQKIGFNIRSLEGISLGRDWNKRFFHDIFNSIYFSMKHCDDFASC